MSDDNAFVRWLLLDGDRLVVAGTLLATVFLLLLGLERAGVVVLTESGAVRTVAGGLVPGLFTFLSIVLAINQLVLSQEFGSADEIRDRVSEVREFRHHVEEASGRAPSPLAPTGFLAAVVGTVARKAERLESDLPADGSAAADAAGTYASAVGAAARRAEESVRATDPGRVNAVISLLEYDDSGQLYDARRLLIDHGAELSADARETLEELVEVLELFSVARTHFRTTYTQRVLARLSRLLLYTGIPAILAAFVLGLSGYSSALDPVRVFFVSGLLTVALSPLAVLFAYILRIATVSERTIGVGPFVSRPGSADDESSPASVPSDTAAADYVATDSASSDSAATDRSSRNGRR